MSDWEDDIYDDEDEELSFEEDEQIEEDSDYTAEPDQSNHDKPNDNSNSQRIDSQELYFRGKEQKDDEKYSDAMVTFSEVINLQLNPDLSNDIFIFKAIKQSIKICQLSGNYSKIPSLIEQLFSQFNRVDRNYGDSSLSKVLFRFEPTTNIPNPILESIYQKFLEFLKQIDDRTTNESRTYLRVNLYMSNLFILEKEYDKAHDILTSLERMVLGSSDDIKSVFLFDVLAAEMTIASEHKFNLHELTRLSKLSSSAITAIPQSRIVGTVKECLGIVCMYSQDYQSANIYFQDSFKAFNECGDPRRVEVLIKLIISNLLSESEINPFRSSDFQGLLQNKNIAIMMQLFNVVQNIKIDQYSKMLHTHDFLSLQANNPFLSHFLPGITEIIRVKFILEYLRVFSRLKLKGFCEKLCISEANLEQLLLRLLNKGKLGNVRLDLVNGLIINEVTAYPNFKTELRPRSLVRNLLRYEKSQYNFTDLKSEAQVLEAKVHHAGESFYPNSSPFELSLHSTDDSISVDQYDKTNDQSSLGNEKSSATADLSSGKFFLVGHMSEKERALKLNRMFYDICVPESFIERVLPLSDLFIVPLCDRKKGFQAKNELMSTLVSYLEYLKVSIPEQRPQEINHTVHLKRVKNQNESQSPIGHILGLSSNNTDKHVPDILKEGMVKKLSPINDKAKNLNSNPIDLSSEQIRINEDSSLFDSIDFLNNCRNGSMLQFKRGLGVILFDHTQNSSDLNRIGFVHRSMLHSDSTSRMGTDSGESGVSNYDSDS